MFMKQLITCLSNVQGGKISKSRQDLVRASKHSCFRMVGFRHSMRHWYLLLVPIHLVPKPMFKSFCPQKGPVIKKVPNKQQCRPSCSACNPFLGICLAPLPAPATCWLSPAAWPPPTACQLGLVPSCPALGAPACWPSQAAQSSATAASCFSLQQLLATTFHLEQQLLRATNLLHHALQNLSSSTKMEFLIQRRSTMIVT